ncbi:PAS domain-containing protein [Hyalangium minutum]|uniref:histidine kinase n=1 Tax=Hyalangium minutum TaxID=394096 RepID=A0A085WLU0_9BACT|nr:PAS domain-containing protein [Hyalangium minutum]KFE68653.1 hypothetical protein DB31_7890 [Hyalangium minutum]
MVLPLHTPAFQQAGSGTPVGGDPKFDPLLDSITDGIVSVDREWRVTYLNAVTERLAGRSRESLLGKVLWAELPDLTQTPFAAAIRQSMETGSQATLTDYFPPTDSWFEIRVFPSAAGLVLILRDITEMRQAEVERLRLLAAERSAREQAERTADRITRLQELTAHLSAARSPEEVMSVAVDRIMASVGANLAMVALPVEGQDVLRTVAYNGHSRQVSHDFQLMPLDAPLPVSATYRSGQPEWLESSEALVSRYPNLHPLLREQSLTRSLASMPMVVESRVVGVLALCFPEPRAFSGDDREFLLVLARHCALAIERSRLLAEVEAQRARLEELVMRAPAVMSVTRGPEHRFVLCNPRYRHLLGGRDVTGLTARQAIPGPEGQNVLDILNRVFATGEPFVGKELPGRLGASTADVTMSESYFDFVYQPLRDAEGRVEGIASFAFEVTDQVLARQTVEELLRDMARSEERFRAFLTATSEIIWDMPPQGEFDADQPGWRTFTGQTRAQLLGWGWLDAVHPEDREYAAREWRRAVAASTPYQGEVRLRRHDGVYRYMQVRAVPVLELNGAVREWVGIHRDITRQREDEAERARLLMREQYHRAQLQGLAQASLAIGRAPSLDQALRVITEQARELIGAHQAVTSLSTGEDWAQAIHTVSLSAKYAAWRDYAAPVDGSGIYAKVCESNQPARMTQAELEAHPRWHGFGAHKGKHPPMRGWLAVPMVDRNGRNLGLIQLSDRYEGDFTAEDEAILVQLARLAAVAIENARLMAESQAANRAKDEFLAVMSHELRTPLTAVLGWTQMLRNQKDNAVIREKGLEVIERNARSLAQLIEDVLDVSRILTGKLALHRKAVDLATVVQAAVEVVRPRAEQKSVSLAVSVGPGTGHVTGDPGRLQQVFWNLLANAVKFTQEGGTVEVQLERAEAEWRVRVKDTGQGIHADALPHLFERFWQADGSSTREHGGLGLGLAIVRHLVELHGGTVEAESAGLGLGATFTVRLPLPVVLPEAERSASGEGAAKSPARLDGVRVLLVEDAEDARELITLLLRDRGAEVRTAANGRDAMERLTEALPDVLISDIGLPGEDGHAVLKRVRDWADTKGEWIPAIALTAYAGAEDARRAYRAGFQVHMAKPLEAEALVEAVAKLSGQE